MNFLVRIKRCYIEDEGPAPRYRLAGAGIKPVYAALVKGHCRERYMKRQFNLSGDFTKDDRKGIIDEVSK